MVFLTVSFKFRQCVNCEFVFLGKAETESPVRDGETIAGGERPSSQLLQRQTSGSSTASDSEDDCDGNSDCGRSPATIERFGEGNDSEDSGH